jgi:hypothetical protein
LLPLLPRCPVSNPPLSLASFHTPFSWDILGGRSIATRDTRSDEHWSADEVTTESLFLKYVSIVKARCSTDQRSMATEILWVSLEGRSRTNFPRQRFHSQLFYKIVRYFCQTLYNLLKGLSLFSLESTLFGIRFSDGSHYSPINTVTG